MDISRIRKALLSFDDRELIEIAQDLIRIPSETELERDVMGYISNLLKSNGIEVEIQEVSPGRPQVIGRIRGTGGGRSLMFNGHLDNDSLTNDWGHENPYEPKIVGNHLWGAGIHNMKSGVAAFLEAALALRRSAISLRGDVVLACVVGELQGGKGTLHMLRSGTKADLAIVPEPYSTNTIITKCVGVHKCAITVLGRSIHTSRSQLGVDAIEKMWIATRAIKNLHLRCDDKDLPGLPKINIASIKGGRGKGIDLKGPSNLADRCIIIVDIRYSGTITTEEINEEIIRTLGRISETDPEFEFEYHHPPPPEYEVGGADMPPTNVPADTEIAEIVASLHKELNGRPVAQRGVVLPYSYCGNDTAHLERWGIPCCLYGPRGDPQDVERHVRIDEMIECSRVLLAAAVHVCS